MPTIKDQNILCRLDNKYLKHLTENFVGRQYIFDEINRFVKNENCGYITIVGNPGEGKSAIVAKYIQNTNCVYHFNSRAYGIINASQFIESISQQLCSRYNLEVPPATREMIKNGIFLQNIINEVANHLERENDKLIIAVDGLDEVQLSSQPMESNVLFLPRFLPDGIFFLLSRRDVEVPFFSRSPQKIVDLRKYYKKCRADFAAYIHLFINKREISKWIKSNNLSKAEFIDLILKNSNYNFMYLFFILKGLSKGEYHDVSIDSLPLGLAGYYKSHWIRMGMEEKGILIDEKLNVLYVLANAKQPLSLGLLSEFTEIPKNTLSSIIEDWNQFINSYSINESTRYSIYHKSFIDFLRDRQTIQTSGDSLENINNLICDSLWGDSLDYPIQLKVRFNQISTEKFEYIVKDLAAHLIEGKKSERLFHLFTNLDYLETKVNYLSIFELYNELNAALDIFALGDPYRTIISSLSIAIGKNLLFINRYPHNLFQCLWNSCWWHDCPERNRFIQEQPTMVNADLKEPKLHVIMEAWRKAKEADPFFSWIRLKTPPLERMGSPEKMVLQAHDDIISDVKFSNDGSFFVSCSRDKTIKLWKASNGQLIYTIYTHKMVNCLSISHDNSLIACGYYNSLNYYQESYIDIFRLSDGVKLVSLRGHFDDINSIDFTDDGSKLLSGSRDTTIRLWDTKNSNELLLIEAYDGPVKSVSFSADSSRLVTVGQLFHPDKKMFLDRQANGENSFSDKMSKSTLTKNKYPDSNFSVIKVWDADANNFSVVSRLGIHEGNAYSAAYSPNGNYIACNFENSVIIYDSQSLVEIKRFDYNLSNPYICCFSRDGCYLAVGYFFPNNIFNDIHYIDVWKINSGELINQIQEYRDKITSMYIDIDLSLLICGSYDKLVKYFSLNISTKNQLINEHMSNINYVKYSGDGEYLYACKSNYILVLDSSTLDKIATIYGSSLNSFFTHLSVSPSNKFIAASAQAIEVWSLDSGKNIFFSLNDSPIPLLSISDFSPNERYIATYGFGKLIIWDLKHKTRYKDLHYDSLLLYRVYFSPDSCYLILHYSLYHYKLCPLNENNELNFSDSKYNFFSCVAFYKDNLILLGTYENELIIWDKFNNKISSKIQLEYLPVEIVYENDSEIIFIKQINGRISAYDIYSFSNICDTLYSNSITNLFNKYKSHYSAGLCENYCVISNSLTNVEVAEFPKLFDFTMNLSSHPSGKRWAFVSSGYIHEIILEINKNHHKNKIDVVKGNLYKQLNNLNSVNRDNKPIDRETIDKYLFIIDYIRSEIIEISKKLFFKAIKFKDIDSLDTSERLIFQSIKISQDRAPRNYISHNIIPLEAIVRLGYADFLFNKQKPEDNNFLNQYLEIADLFINMHSVYSPGHGEIIHESAIQHYLKGKFTNAKQGFYQAYFIYNLFENQIEAINSIGNYAICDVELGKIDKAEPHLVRMAEVMNSNNDFRERNARHYLAKIYDLKNDYKCATEHQNIATTISKKHFLDFLKDDEKYLALLKDKLAKKNALSDDSNSEISQFTKEYKIKFTPGLDHEGGFLYINQFRISLSSIECDIFLVLYNQLINDWFDNSLEDDRGWVSNDDIRKAIHEWNDIFKEDAIINHAKITSNYDTDIINAIYKINKKIAKALSIEIKDVNIFENGKPYSRKRHYRLKVDPTFMSRSDL